MKNKACLIVLIATLGAIGMVKNVAAAPDDSQRLRGLGGRTFAVEVENLTDGGIFNNCYTFNKDQSWIDPMFLDPEFIIPGTWEQDSTGAKTSYTASAWAVLEDEGIGILLTQVGTVTPAKGGGILQLDADNTVDITDPNDPTIIFVTFYLKSVGYQDDECLLEPE